MSDERCAVILRGMTRSRQPKGTPQGGQFATNARPDEQRVLSALALEVQAAAGSPQVSEAEARQFFDDLEHMAGVGIQIEHLIERRSQTLEVALEKDDLHSDFLLNPRMEHDVAWRTRRSRLLTGAKNAKAINRAVAVELFDLLEGCLLEGGHKERQARQALKLCGFELRRSKVETGYRRGVIWTDRRYGFSRWESPEGAALTLKPIQSQSVAANEPSDQTATA